MLRQSSAPAVTAFAMLDWTSFFQVLPGICLTPWNPPRAASLALLVIKGLRCVPRLFAAGVVSDVMLVGRSLVMSTTVATNAVAAIGYTVGAATLKISRGLPCDERHVHGLGNHLPFAYTMVA